MVTEAAITQPPLKHLSAGELKMAGDSPGGPSQAEATFRKTYPLPDFYLTDIEGRQYLFSERKSPDPDTVELYKKKIALTIKNKPYLAKNLNSTYFDLDKEQGLDRYITLSSMGPELVFQWFQNRILTSRDAISLRTIPFLQQLSLTGLHPRIDQALLNNEELPKVLGGERNEIGDPRGTSFYLILFGRLGSKQARLLRRSIHDYFMHKAIGCYQEMCELETKSIPHKEEYLSTFSNDMAAFYDIAQGFKGWPEDRFARPFIPKPQP